MRLPTVHAPELARDLEWLNTPRPLTLRELRGQLVILDFWTYCCINCMHVIPILRRLEERHAGDPLVVIGVHSAKFDEEKDAAAIADAIRRYDVRHPVVVDRDMMVALCTRSDRGSPGWPTGRSRRAPSRTRRGSRGRARRSSSWPTRARTRCGGSISRRAR